MNMNLDFDFVIGQIKDKTHFVINTLKEYGFPQIDFDVVIDKLNPGIAGCAQVYRKKIFLSIDYLREYLEQILNDTLPHEICHLYVTKYFPNAKQHHGPEFRRLMGFLGLEGKTYHNMVLKEAPNKARRVKTRYVYVAETSGQKYMLTPIQHKKNVSGKSKFVEKGTGEILKYFGETVNFV